VLVAMIAYCVSVMFGMIGFLPAGLGFVEISLAATLVSFGSTVASATAAAVVFRVFELWIPLLAGGLVVRDLGHRPRVATGA